jgi:hypothetical protein
MAKIFPGSWLGKNPAPAVKPEAAASSAAALAATTLQAASARGPLLDIVASAIRMRSGESAEELAAAIASNGACCELDPELTDDDGYPLLSGRVAALDETALQETIAPWLAQQGMSTVRLSSEQWRALALGSAVVGELAQHALMHDLLPAYAAAAPAGRAAIALPLLQLLPVLPTEWDAAQRELVQQWFLHLAAQQGWPAQRIALAPGAESIDSSNFSLLHHLAPQGTPWLAMLVACASHIGDDSVRDWSERGLLFTSRNPRGQIPGEGAAGLLLADKQQAQLLEAGSQVQLHSARDGRRTTSADAAGSVSCELLSKLGVEALRDGGADPATISLVTADTDLRPSRMAELMGMVNATLPQLDVSTQVMSAGACCGSAAAVAALAGLALAQHEVAAKHGQVLFVSNLDPHRRVAIVVRGA